MKLITNLRKVVHVPAILHVLDLLEFLPSPLLFVEASHGNFLSSPELLFSNELLLDKSHWSLVMDVYLRFGVLYW